MKTTNWKAMVAKMFTVGLLAGAVVMAAPAKADAQVSFGVRFGRPVYVAPAPVYVAPGYGYYDRDFRRDGWERHEAFERREAIERQERFEHERFEHFHHVDGWGR